jgi:threonine/homoserine/homoserine lactone efflux protein
MALLSNLVAASTGFLSGLLISVPVGPINLSIINEGARRGFKWAALIGAGATTMEVIYCSIAFTSFAAFFQEGGIKAAMEVFSFAFLLFLGVKFVMAKSVPVMDQLEERIEQSIEKGIERQFHPTSAFMTGFVRTLANPMVLLGWIILGANFISRGWVEPTMEGKLSCLGGVAVGVAAWFFGLSWTISLGHRKFTAQTMIRMERGSGVLLLLLGAIHGLHLAWQLAKHYGPPHLR